MNIALILLNYNDYKTTIKYIEFVKKYTSINNIIVVDNCSTDKSYEKLKSYESKKISIIQSNKNGGYAYGNNIGIKYANKYFTPEYIIISNPDVYFEENIITIMREYLDKNKDVAIVSPTVINNENSNMPIAWKRATYISNIISMSIILGKIFYFRKHYNVSHFTSEYSVVDVVPGSFFMINYNIFSEINLFDENTFLFGEEDILSYKLYEKGYKSVILNNIFYKHEHSVSINKTVSLVKKYEILYKSLDYYNKVYLNSGKIKNYIFYMFWKVSCIEKYFISLIENIKRKINYEKNI